MGKGKGGEEERKKRIRWIKIFFSLLLFVFLSLSSLSSRQTLNSSISTTPFRIVSVTPEVEREGRGKES